MSNIFGNQVGRLKEYMGCPHRKTSPFSVTAMVVVVPQLTWVTTFPSKALTCMGPKLSTGAPCPSCPSFEKPHV